MKVLPDFLYYDTKQYGLNVLTGKNNNNLTNVNPILKGLFHYSCGCAFFWHSQSWLIDHSSAVGNPIQMLLILHHFKRLLEMCLSVGRKQSCWLPFTNLTQRGPILWLQLPPYWHCWKLWATDFSALLTASCCCTKRKRKILFGGQMWQLSDGKKIPQPALATQLCFHLLHLHSSPVGVSSVREMFINEPMCVCIFTIKMMWLKWDCQISLCLSKVLFRSRLSS